MGSATRTSSGEIQRSIPPESLEDEEKAKRIQFIKAKLSYYRKKVSDLEEELQLLQGSGDITTVKEPLSSVTAVKEPLSNNTAKEPLSNVTAVKEPLSHTAAKELLSSIPTVKESPSNITNDSKQPEPPKQAPKDTDVNSSDSELVTTTKRTTSSPIRSSRPSDRQSLTKSKLS